MPEIDKESYEKLKQQLKKNLDINLQMIEVILKENGVPEPKEDLVYKLYQNNLQLIHMDLDL